MALKWLLNSALTQVLLGHTDTNNVVTLQPTNVNDQGTMRVQECLANKSLKDPAGRQGVSSSATVPTAGVGRRRDHESGFQMPLHYPRYKKADYEKMEEWRIDMLLAEYGLSFKGTLEEKRAFAMGAFLWPDQI